MERGDKILMSKTKVMEGDGCKYTYTGTDHQKIVTEIIIDYFNEVGNLLIKVKSEGRYLKPEECDHNYVRAMVKTGLMTDSLSGGFKNGVSSDISKILFNKTSMDYSEYFLEIFRTLRQTYEEWPDFKLVTYNNDNNCRSK